MGNGLKSEIPRLAALIWAVAAYHPRGLRVLLGDEPEPTLAEIDEVLNGIASKPDLGTTIDGGRPSQAALDLICRMGAVSLAIDRAGGWDNITWATREVKDHEPIAWSLFAESVLWVGKGSRLENEGGHITRIAAKYNVTYRTVLRWKEETPRLIARLAMQGGPGVLCLNECGNKAT